MFRGESNHAGTTPMWVRRDALMGLAKSSLGVREYGLKNQRFLVILRITIGRADIYPGVYNAVPGLISFMVEARSPDPVVLDNVERFLKHIGEAIAVEENLEFGIRRSFTLDRSILTAMLPQRQRRRAETWVSAIRRCGAGHDAQNMAKISKAGMIFAPSVGGKSRSREEYTRDEDLIKGLEVLLETGSGSIEGREATLFPWITVSAVWSIS